MYNVPGVTQTDIFCRKILHFFNVECSFDAEKAFWNGRFKQLLVCLQAVSQGTSWMTSKSQLHDVIKCVCPTLCAWLLRLFPSQIHYGISKPRAKRQCYSGIHGDWRRLQSEDEELRLLDHKPFSAAYPTLWRNVIVLCIKWHKSVSVSVTHGVQYLSHGCRIKSSHLHLWLKTTILT